MRSIEFALPRTMISPARQSISSSRSLATSPDRIPRRTNMVRMAMSRQPRRVVSSHDAKRRRTWSGANPFGSPTNRRPATGGTAETKDSSMTASRCRNLRKDRRAVTVSFAAPRLCRGQPSEAWGRERSSACGLRYQVGAAVDRRSRRTRGVTPRRHVDSARRNGGTKTDPMILELPPGPRRCVRRPT